jgi:hypothetical protein
MTQHNELCSPFPNAKLVSFPIVLQDNVSRIFYSGSIKMQTRRKDKVSSTGHSISREGFHYVVITVRLAPGLYTFWWVPGSSYSQSCLKVWSHVFLVPQFSWLAHVSMRGIPVTSASCALSWNVTLPACSWTSATHDHGCQMLRPQFHAA